MIGTQGQVPLNGLNGLNGLEASRVAPVTATPNLGFLLGPAGAALARHVNPPEFKGDWVEFSGEFEEYMEHLESTAGVISDPQKLRFLVGCVGETPQKEFKVQKDLGKNWTYHSFHAWMARNYGNDPRMTAREQIRALRPLNEGKLTQEEWRRVWAEFRNLRRRVDDFSEEEARVWLLERLPQTFRTRLVREETRRTQRTPA